MKKQLAIILALVAASGTLVSCGGGGSSGGLHKATLLDYNGSLKRDAADLTVTFELGGYGDQWIVDLKNEFQDATGKSVYIEGEKGISGYAADRWESGKQCSDVFFVDDGHTPWVEVAKGLVEDISGVMTSEVENGQTVNDIIYDSFADFGEKDGKTYFLPWTVGVGGIFYNTEIFQQAGWTTPPKTYSELLELVDDINNLPCNTDATSDNDIAPFAWSGKVSNYWQFLVDTWFVQIIGLDNYKYYEKMDNEKFYDPSYVWTNPETGETVNFAAAKQEALSLLEGLVVNKASKQVINTIPTYATKDYVFVQAAFADGEAAMCPNGAWLERELSNAGISEKKLEKISVMSVPFAPNARKNEQTEYIQINNTLGYNYVCVPKKAQHKDLAKEFLLFSLKQSNLKSFTYESYGFRPFNYDINSASLSFCAAEVRELILDAETANGNFTFNSKGTLALNGYAASAGWLYNAFGNMLTGSTDSRKSAAECIAEEKKQATLIFENYK